MCPHRLIHRGLAVRNARDDLGAVLRHELLDSGDLCLQARADTAQGFMRGHCERAPVALVIERHNAGLVLGLFLGLFLGLILGGLVLGLLLGLALIASAAQGHMVVEKSLVRKSSRTPRAHVGVSSARARRSGRESLRPSATAI